MSHLQRNEALYHMLGNLGYTQLSLTEREYAFYNDGGFGQVAPAPDPGTGYMALLSAPTGARSVRLEWDFAEDPNPAHDSFELERKKLGEAYVQIATPLSGVLSYEDTGLDAGTLYIYRVRAIISGVAQDWSNETQVFTAPAPAIDDLSVGDVTASTIELNWTEPSGFATQYRIYDASDDSVVDTVAAPATGYQVGSLSQDTSYSFYVTVLYDGFESDVSNTVTQTTAQTEPMVLEVDTNNSPGDPVKLPYGGTFNLQVDWGDGSVEDWTTGEAIDHTYATDGIYTIQVRGFADSFGSTALKTQYVRCTSWGELGLTSLYRGFASCTNLIEVPTTLPTSVTNISRLFQSATSFNQDIGSWNVSNVTDMGATFRSATSFNQDISTWNTGNVTTMKDMFWGNTAFNQDIGNWDTSSVTDMSLMFLNSVFDQDIGSWDIGQATTMVNMFFGTSLSTVNYDALLIGWESQAVQNNVSFNGGNSTYTSGGAAEAARTALINDHSWTITDGGPV